MTNCRFENRFRSQSMSNLSPSAYLPSTVSNLYYCVLVKVVQWLYDDLLSKVNNVEDIIYS